MPALHSQDAKSPRSRKATLFATKISDYQFRKILWHFVLDHSVRETSRHVTISANSIGAIFAKLRRFFFDAGLFTDSFERRDLPKETDEARFRLFIIDFHLKRVAAKRSNLDSNGDAPAYHFAESNWRAGFELLRAERDPALIDRMMFEHLLAFIKRFGPVGSPRALTREQRLAGLRLALTQFEQRLIWLERNATRFRDGAARSALRTLRTS